MELHTDFRFGTLQVEKRYVLSVQDTGTIYVCAPVCAPRMRVLSILQYQSIVQTYYRNATAAIVVYDITEAVSCTMCCVSMLFLQWGCSACMYLSLCVCAYRSNVFFGLVTIETVQMYKSATTLKDNTA